MPVAPASLDPALDAWLDAGDADAELAVLDGELDAAMVGLLDEVPPGPPLAALLNTLPLAGLDADALVGYAAACARLTSWAAAREAAATAALTDRVRDYRGVGGGADDEIEVTEMAAAELGAGLTLSRVAAANRVGFARDLARLPGTRLALAAGRIDPIKARAITEATRPLDDPDAAAVEARVLTRAPTQTAAQLRACLRRAVAAVDPAAAADRHRQASIERGVWRSPLPDGMARLDWVGPAEQVAATHTWITETAQAARHADRARARAQAAAGAPPDPVRSLHQCRSDVLADLGEHALATLTLPRRHGRRPHIAVLVGLNTLLGLDDQPAELAGHGPITAETARRIAADGVWQRLLTDPVTGALAAMSSQHYQPPQHIRDAVIARDRTCRWPGCRTPADRCDLDHTLAWPCGPTCPANLRPLCRTHHRIKTLTDTTIHTDPAGGQWITLPSGRRYHRPAEPLLDHPAPTPDPRRPTEPPDDPDPPPDDYAPPF